MPSYVKNVPYSEVENIDFTSARKLKSKLDVSIDNLDSSTGETLTIANIGVRARSDLGGWCPFCPKKLHSARMLDC